MKGKRGVSAVVVTVALILVSIVAVGIITSFVVPMVKTQLGKASACLELRDHFNVLVESTATCYNSTNVKLSIQRGFEKEEAKGFSVIAYTDTGESQAELFLNGTAPGIPNKGGSKIYVLPVNGKVERVIVATILPNDDVCDGQDFVGIRPC